MSLPHDILIILTSYNQGYKIMRRHAHGLPSIPYSELKKTFKKPEGCLSVTLSRLKKNGLVMQDGRFWRITDRGKKFLSEHPHLAVALRHKKRTLQEGHGKKNMIVAFDIPEQYRRKRNWLRIELVNLGFIKIQKSFWFGPEPLPRDFVESLHSLALLPYLKFFNAKEEEIV